MRFESDRYVEAWSNYSPLLASKTLTALPTPPERVMSNWKERISFNPKQCGGRPCIRGMRIRVIDILDLLVAGLSSQDILEEMPDLEAEDIEAALRYARSRIDHPVIAA